MALTKVQVKFEVRNFARSWDNSEYLKKVCAVPGYAVQGRWFWYQSKARNAYMTSY